MIVWRIGQLARMAGVSERTLRYYDRIGLLVPAAVGRETGYRWYGSAELVRLERIRGLQRLGLSLRQIADVVDASDDELHGVLAEAVDALRRDIADKTAALAAAEDRLAAGAAILPQETAVGERRWRIRRVRVGHPSELAALCGEEPEALLTWLTGHPAGGFTAAVPVRSGGETLTLPARRVVRTVVPPELDLVRAGTELLAFLGRQGLAIAGPTLEERLVDEDGVAATVLEVPVR
ncbi:MerR family transcriptional regulator [Glycomyces albidus]|nr:MerR family transcriptional regulator [Glycomyces albidus]